MTPRSILCTAWLLLGLAWPNSAYALVRERGVGNNTPEVAEIVPLPTPTEAGGLLIYGQLEPAGDVDYFRIAGVPADSALSITLLQVEGASFDDAVLYAVSPGFLETHVSDDEGGLAPNLVLPITEDNDGDWAVGVGGFASSGSASNESFKYRLVVSWGNPSIEEAANDGSTPPIDELDLVAPGGALVVRGDLESPSDPEDTFSVSVPKGRMLVASVFDRTGNSLSDPVLEVIDPAASASVDDDGAASLFAWLYDLLPGTADTNWTLRVKRFNAADQSRALPYDLVVAAPGEPCDVDGDASVTRNDVTNIFDRRNQVVALADLGDYDGNRKLSVLDSRACEVVCRNANGGSCPTIQSSCGLLGLELLIPVFALRAALRRSRRGRSR